VNFGYDNSSRVNSFTDELGNSASITYTNGLVTSITDRKSQQFGFTYDDVGLLTEISMPNSQEITFEYDSLNRLTHFTDLVGTSDFTYDDIGRLTSTDDPYDFTHELTYNAESMITALSAEGDSRSYAWDTSGRMTEATRNNLTTDYTYNDASWVTRIDYPNSTNTNYTYNTRGWMTAIELKDSNNNTIFNLPYSYDANGNVTSETVGSDSISYTYDALNRLTFIDRPGTTNDTTYTYDSRGNRTQMQTGSVTNYLTFNAADELTRVDKPNNAYDTYTYDNNGNCTSMNVFYPQPLLASKNTENDKTNFMTHYPADYAPKPVSRWRYLSPYLPSVGDITPLYDTISKVNPEKAKWDREERWRELCMPMQDPDETTSLTYSSDNNLTHADLPNGNDLDFKYDAAGRRMEKKLTSVSGSTTTVTTYKYHYIGSQITTIEIDQTQTTGESTTTTKDDEMRIHLGANSRPISFEYYTENQGTQQTTSATYYYHYDLHGNVIRVTNSSGTTVIQYTYDQLGTIVSETNSSSIYNPFTYMGEAQVIHDVEFDTSSSSPKTGLYNSGSGYYNPETGTFLGGSGTPASVNPTSASAEEPTAQSTKPAGQLGAHAGIAAAKGGVPSSAGVASSTDVEPAAPFEGINLCGEVATSCCDAEDVSDSLAQPLSPPIFDPFSYSDTVGGKSIEEKMKEMADFEKKTKAWRDSQIKKLEDDYRDDLGKKTSKDPRWIKEPVYDAEGNLVSPGIRRNEMPADRNIWDYYRYMKDCAVRGISSVPEDVYWAIRENMEKNGSLTLPKDLADALEFAVWTIHDGSTWLFSYKLKGSNPHFFYGPHASQEKQHVEDGVCPGAEVDFTRPVKSCGKDSCSLDYPLGDTFMVSWGSEGADYHSSLKHLELSFVNNTGVSLNILLKMNHSDGSPETQGWFSIISLFIPGDNSGKIADGSLGISQFGNNPNLPDFMDLNDPLGTCYINKKKYFCP
jgi:YD repeat-containing protein